MQQLPDFMWSIYTQAQILIDSNKHSKTSLESAPTDLQNSNEAQLTQTLAFHQQGQLNEAGAVYRALLLKLPKHAELLHRLAGPVCSMQHRLYDCFWQMCPAPHQPH